MKKIYLAGKISNNSKYKEDFRLGKKQVRDLYGKDIIILDPSILPSGLTEKEYMTICMSMINCCDGLFLLSNYKESVGALVEKAYAEKVGIPVIGG